MIVLRRWRALRLPLDRRWASVALVSACLVLPQCRASSASRPSNSLPGPGHTANAPGAAESSSGSESAIARSVHVALGVPRDADASDDYYLDERVFVLSYNARKRVPNWVAWRLDASQLGSQRRKNDFRPDPLLPAAFYHVSDRDYRRSGYDRGHLCPSADRSESPADNSRTFLFTNIEPQLHELNAGPWEQLEEYVRRRVRRGQISYLVAGGVISEPYATIGNGVAVPVGSFKIIAFLDDGQTANDVSIATEVLAVMMPNQPGVGQHAWTEYLTSVDAIEQASGYDFLNAVSVPVQRIIEARTARP